MRAIASPFKWVHEQSSVFLMEYIKQWSTYNILASWQSYRTFVNGFIGIISHSIYASRLQSLGEMRYLFDTV